MVSYILLLASRYAVSAVRLGESQEGLSRFVYTIHGVKTTMTNTLEARNHFWPMDISKEVYKSTILDVQANSIGRPDEFRPKGMVSSTLPT